MEALRRQYGCSPVELTGSAAALYERQNVLSWELRASTSLARLRHGQRRPRPARKLPSAVYRRFTEGFGTADLESARSTFQNDSGRGKDSSAPTAYRAPHDRSSSAGCIAAGGRDGGGVSGWSLRRSCISAGDRYHKQCPGYRGGVRRNHFRCRAISRPMRGVADVGPVHEIWGGRGAPAGSGHHGTSRMSRDRHRSLAWHRRERGS